MTKLLMLFNVWICVALAAAIALKIYAMFLNNNNALWINMIVVAWCGLLLLGNVIKLWLERTRAKLHPDQVLGVIEETKRCILADCFNTGDTLVGHVTPEGEWVIDERIKMDP